METVVGSLVGVSGHTEDTKYDLIFTTQRVISVLIKHPLDVPYQPRIAEIFIGGKLAHLDEERQREKIAQERRLALSGTLDELAAAHPLNSEIPYDAINSVEVTRGFFRSQLKFNVTESAAAGKRTRFTLRRQQVPEARRLLARVLPSKLKKS